MIRNNRELEVTRVCVRRFAEAISQARDRGAPEDVDALLWNASIEGLESQLSTLEAEIAAYCETKIGAASGS